jgi:hypothetical protein
MPRRPGATRYGHACRRGSFTRRIVDASIALRLGADTRRETSMAGETQVNEPIRTVAAGSIGPRW